MALLRWIIALPFIIGAVLFALAHPEKVSVTLNPLQDAVELPLYFVALLFLGIGFILGALVAWLGMSQTRKERRQYKKEVKTLTKEADKQNKKIETLEGEIETARVTISKASHTNIIDVDHG